MKLIIQPEDGATSLLNGIDRARESIEIAIFRFDHLELKRALERAVDRGVAVHALIANTNRGNEKALRKLEMEFLPAGIVVSRTASDLLRHHYKFMIVDHRELYLLTFNFTYLDMEGSRSFGVITDEHEYVREASRLFHADIRRQAYRPELAGLIVSPENARGQLARFLKGARKQLLIYDPEISDRRMIGLLRERARKGIEIRIIGRMTKESPDLDSGRSLSFRFHTRTIIRDKREVFLGSQSLREADLDRRRELGLIVTDRSVVLALLHVFEKDWGTISSRDAESETVKKMAKAVVRELPLGPIVESALKGLQAVRPDSRVGPAGFARRLASAVKDAVKEAVLRATRKRTAA